MFKKLIKKIFTIGLEEQALQIKALEKKVDDLTRALNNRSNLGYVLHYEKDSYSLHHHFIETHNGSMDKDIFENTRWGKWSDRGALFLAEIILTEAFDEAFALDYASLFASSYLMKLDAEKSHLISHQDLKSWKENILPKIKGIKS